MFLRGQSEPSLFWGSWFSFASLFSSFRLWRQDGFSGRFGGRLSGPLRRQVVSVWTAFLVKCLILPRTPNKISPGASPYQKVKLVSGPTDLPQRSCLSPAVAHGSTHTHRRTHTHTHCSHVVGNPEINPLQSDRFNIYKLIVVNFLLLSDVCLDL